MKLRNKPHSQDTSAARQESRQDILPAKTSSLLDTRKMPKMSSPEADSAALLVGVPSFLVKTYDIVNVSPPLLIVCFIGPRTGPRDLLEPRRRELHSQTAERVRRPDPAPVFQAQQLLVLCAPTQHVRLPQDEEPLERAVLLPRELQTRPQVSISNNKVPGTN